MTTTSGALSGNAHDRGHAERREFDALRSGQRDGEPRPRGVPHRVAHDGKRRAARDPAASRCRRRTARPCRARPRRCGGRPRASARASSSSGVNGETANAIGSCGRSARKRTALCKKNGYMFATSRRRVPGMKSTPSGSVRSFGASANAPPASASAPSIARLPTIVDAFARDAGAREVVRILRVDRVRALDVARVRACAKIYTCAPRRRAAPARAPRASRSPPRYCTMSTPAATPGTDRPSAKRT